jgi:ribosomal subunit interface protein
MTTCRAFGTYLHQMASSPAIEARIREKAAELERFSDRITGCRVIVEKEHRHRHKGDLFRVRIEIDVPGKELAVTHTGPRDHAHEDIYVAIRDAFNAAVRRLEDHVREHGGKVKVHEVPLHGTVRMVDHEAGFGFVETAQGEVYFHRNSVVEGVRGHRAGRPDTPRGRGGERRGLVGDHGPDHLQASSSVTEPGVSGGQMARH